MDDCRRHLIFPRTSATCGSRDWNNAMATMRSSSLLAQSFTTGNGLGKQHHSEFGAYTPAGALLA